jgi:hypothetical protein
VNRLAPGVHDLFLFAHLLSLHMLSKKYKSKYAALCNVAGLRH